MLAIAVWSLAIKPGKPVPFIPGCDIRITNAALTDELGDKNGRTSVKLTFKPPISNNGEDDEDENDAEDDDAEVAPKTTVLCSLTPGKIEQSTLDLVIEEEEEYLFEVVGQNTVYLTGNYIQQDPMGPPLDDEDLSSDGEDYDLTELGYDEEGDSEIDEIESDAGRFEEVTEEQGVSLKRSRDDDMEVDTSVSKVTKKTNKKQKGENGDAVPTAATTEDVGETENPEEASKKSKKDKKKEKKEKKKQEGKKEQEGSASAAGNSSTGKTKELPGGLKIKDSKIGTGPQAKAGSKVAMRYIGKLTDGTVFDSNTKGKPFSFRLGDGEVIKGWDQGLVGMQVGGERELVIPPGLAYGKQKQKGIPAGSTLIFECKLLEIK